MAQRPANRLKRLEQRLINLPVVKQLLDWSKTHSLPGFFQVPIFDVAVFLYNESRRVTIIMRANAVAFSFFLSLFPAIIAVFTLITMLPIYDIFQSELNSYIDYIMPSTAGEQLKVTIQNLVKPDTRVLSLSFLLALYFSSNGMLALMAGFEKSHLKSFKKRPGWEKRLLAIGLTLLLALLLLVSVVMIVLGKMILNFAVEYFHLDIETKVYINIFRWLVIVALFYFGIAFIYRYGVALKRKLPWLTPGATLATILSIISSLLFSFYVNAFNTYNQIYGSIGTIIVLMLWIQINCMVLMVGFELNASIAVNRDLKLAREEEGEDNC
ncbi:MAG: ribonuclease BN [Saprospirales bacterium]|nr:ribonuclease BN [Saprospirales bacterium]